jgi:predicted transposase YbfD/YdcC
LCDILILSVLAVIAGAEGWEDIEEFGIQKKGWLKKFLKLHSGIPSHDTISRVFRMLKPGVFQEAFLSWIKELHEDFGLETVAIDGKSLRRSHDRSSMKKMLHSVSAWSATNRLMLGQLAVDEKSNEITAIPKLLQFLELEGAVVTTDAMGCQKEIADQIVEQGGDYMLAVKDNQPTLAAEITDLFNAYHDEQSPDLRVRSHETKEKAHGRHEHRMYFQAALQESFLEKFPEWRGLKTVVQVMNVTEREGKETTDVRYYISSLPLGVKKAATSIRNHWGIENTLHWVLDTTFNEDQSRIRKGHGAENFALLRRLAINIIQQDTSKGSIKKKRKRAAWNEDFLLNLIQQAA